MFRISRILKDWKESGALHAHLNLYGFWDEHTFVTKSGDLGVVLRVRGIDYESLDAEHQDYSVKRLEAALKVFGPGTHIYQILSKRNRPEIPFANYDDPIIHAAVEQRRQFFESKRDRLFEIEIHYVVLIEGRYAKRGLLEALKSLPTQPRAAYEQLAASLSKTSMKTLLAGELNVANTILQQKVHSFIRQLSDMVEITILQKEAAFQVFYRLLNLEPWKIANARLLGPRYLDTQLCDSNIEANRDHLRVGDYYVRILTMKDAVSETRPLLLRSLLEIETNFHIVTEWMPLDSARSRNEIKKRKRHFNSTKSSMFSALQDPRTVNPRDVLYDESQQADIESLGSALATLGDGQALGEFSLSILLYDTDKAVMDRAVPDFARAFTTHDGSLHVETYNLLNAFFATVPGNYAFNLRRAMLLNSNYADLSFLFTIHPGEKHNPHLNAEYLAVLETDNATPYYLNLHNRDVAHTLVLGYTGSGKSFLLNFLVQNMQKYRPLTYIFDLGGSFEGLTRIFGGSYLNIGVESCDFSVNPFSLEPSSENLNFLYMLLRVLIEGGKYQLSYGEEQQLYSAIERVYILDPEQRTLTNLADLVGPLKDRLHRWVRGGQYGYAFDNAVDTLTFSRFQTFNFDQMDEHPDVLEPLLFYILHRASNEIANKSQLGTFKAFLLDEAWIFLKNRTVREYITQAQKTWRKLNAAMILATQSVDELARSEMLNIVNENCPTKIFLANPDLDRELYREGFHLNDTEIEIIAGLVPPGQMLIRKHDGSKKVRLHVDSLSYWMATNNARDNIVKQDYFNHFGIVEGLRRLAKEFPFVDGKIRLRRKCSVA